MTVIMVKEEAEKKERSIIILIKKIQHFARGNHVMHITIMQ